MEPVQLNMDLGELDMLPLPDIDNNLIQLIRDNPAGHGIDIDNVANLGNEMSNYWRLEQEKQNRLEYEQQQAKIRAEKERFRTELENRREKSAVRHIATLLKDDPDSCFADAKILSKDGKEFRAHKCILLARSPVLKAMLTSGMKESISGIIRMEEHSSTVDAILHFIYTCEIRPFATESNDKGLVTIDELIDAATKYQIVDLTDYFDQILGTLCDETNASVLLHLANKYSLSKGQSDIKSYIKAHPPVLDDVLDDHQ